MVAAPAPCPNCGSAQVGRFCPDCGQRRGELHPALIPWLKDALEELLSLEGRLLRTLRLLLARPGGLTVAWMRGERVRHTPPLRLYMVSSVSFFLMLQIAGPDPFPLYESFGGPTRAQLQAAAALGGWDAAATVLDSYQNLVKTIVTVGLIVTVPMIAAVLKLVLVRARRWLYVDHLVHALHVAATVLIVWTVTWPFLFTQWTTPLAWTAGSVSLVYGAVSFYRVYQLPVLYVALLFPAVFGLGAAAGGALLAGVGGSWAGSRLNVLGGLWTEQYRREMEIRFDQLARHARDAAVVAERAARVRVFFDVAPTFVASSPHFQADYAELSNFEGRPAETMRRASRLMSRNAFPVSVVGAAAEASALLGDSADASRFYGDLLEAPDEDATGSFLQPHGWVLQRHRQKAAAWFGALADSTLLPEGGR